MSQRFKELRLKPAQVCHEDIIFKYINIFDRTKTGQKGQRGQSPLSPS
jgi:hypothetical protein